MVFFCFDLPSSGHSDRRFTLRLLETFVLKTYISSVKKLKIQGENVRFDFTILLSSFRWHTSFEAYLGLKTTSPPGSRRPLVTLSFSYLFSRGGSLSRRSYSL